MSRRTSLRLYRIGPVVLIECDKCGPVGVQTGTDVAAALEANQHLAGHGLAVTE